MTKKEIVTQIVQELSLQYRCKVRFVAWVNRDKRWVSFATESGKVIIVNPRVAHDAYDRYKVVSGNRSFRGIHISHTILRTFSKKPRRKNLGVLHRDDDRSNNSISNLYWGTSLQNMHDARRNRRFLSLYKLSVSKKAKYWCPALIIVRNWLRVLRWSTKKLSSAMNRPWPKLIHILVGRIRPTIGDVYWFHQFAKTPLNAWRMRQETPIKKGTWVIL